MSFNSLIKNLEEKYPKLFAAEKISISVDSFKKQLEYFYNEGKKEGDKTGYSRAELFYVELNKNSKKPANNNDFNDLFGGIFGKNYKL